MVGAQTEVGEKCGVKRSLIGQHCKVKDFVKINNSVIMNNVTINKGCVFFSLLVLVQDLINILKFHLDID